MSDSQTQNFDAVIVGAGVSGAMIAWQLGLKGKRVLILEAGDPLPPNVNDYMQQFYLATAKVPEIPYTPDLMDSTGLVDPGTMNAPRPTVLTLGDNWQDPKQAYLDQTGKLPFASTYERVSGGTMRHWLGTSLRFVPHDFTMKTTYDRLVDWPIGYNDLERWYGDAEHAIGVSADKADQSYHGIEFPPDYNYPMPKIPLSLVDQAVATAVNGMELDGEVLTVRSTPAGRNSQPYDNRRVCAGNTNCIPICPIQAKYDPSVTLNKALDTGNVVIWARTVANNVVVDGTGKVSQIDYIQYADTRRSRHRARQRHRQGVHPGRARDRDAQTAADVQEQRPHTQRRGQQQRSGRAQPDGSPDLPRLGADAAAGVRLPRPAFHRRNRNAARWYLPQGSRRVPHRDRQRGLELPDR